MAFKMKGINSLTNNSLSKQVRRGSSPLFETDPSFKEMSEEIEITNSVKDLQGNDFATERTITTPGDRKVEEKASSNQAFLDSFAPEFAKAKEEGFEGTLPEYIKRKEEKIGYKGKKIDQVRDYTSGLITKEGDEFENRFFKQRKGWADGYSDEAFEMGDFLAARLNEGFDEDQWGKRPHGAGSGDPKKYITENEAMEYYRKFNNPDQPNRGITGDKKARKTWINNYFNWRKQRGLPEVSMSYQKGYKPTSYKNTENKGKNWRNKN
tara:strand:- start:14 stop:811 length:798 start_codon:yes stop_codon:yes gene_type:complete